MVNALAMFSIIILLAACQNAGQAYLAGPTSSASSYEEALYETQESEYIPFQLPEMTEEQRHFAEQYLNRLLWNNMLLFDWSAEDFRYISTAPDGLSVSIHLMMAFEDIVGEERMREMWNEYGIYFPADTVEEVLLRYFPFTVSQIREILYSIYDEISSSYTYSSGRGGGPRVGIVSDIKKRYEFVKLSYGIYGPGIGSHYVDTLWLSGILTLKQTDYGFMFWSVETASVGTTSRADD